MHTKQIIKFDTRPLLKPPQTLVGADAWEVVGDGRLKITVDLEYNGARVVYLI